MTINFLIEQLTANPTTSLPQTPINVYYCSANVRSSLQFSIPEGKLFYPEPFIASPSRFHTDVSFIHVLYYWPLLWMLLTFTIYFFFISFICVIRWCGNRTRPRRSVRGAHRSKLGSLVTIWTPASLVLAVLCIDSTDSVSPNSCFDVGEPPINVQPYRWGWECYYPKIGDMHYSTLVNLPLNYNNVHTKNPTLCNPQRPHLEVSENRIMTPAQALIAPLRLPKGGGFKNLNNPKLSAERQHFIPRQAQVPSEMHKPYLKCTTPTSINKNFVISSEYIDKHSCSYVHPLNNCKQSHSFLTVNAYSILSQIPFYLRAFLTSIDSLFKWSNLTEAQYKTHHTTRNPHNVGFIFGNNLLVTNMYGSDLVKLGRTATRLYPELLRPANRVSDSYFFDKFFKRYFFPISSLGTNVMRPNPYIGDLVTQSQAPNGPIDNEIITQTLKRVDPSLGVVGTRTWAILAVFDPMRDDCLGELAFIRSSDPRDVGGLNSELTRETVRAYCRNVVNVQLSLNRIWGLYDWHPDIFYIDEYAIDDWIANNADRHHADMNPSAE